MSKGGGRNDSHKDIHSGTHAVDGLLVVCCCCYSFGQYKFLFFLLYYSLCLFLIHSIGCCWLGFCAVLCGIYYIMRTDVHCICGFGSSRVLSRVGLDVHATRRGEGELDSDSTLWLNSWLDGNTHPNRADPGNLPTLPTRPNQWTNEKYIIIHIKWGQINSVAVAKQCKKSDE